MSVRGTHVPEHLRLPIAGVTPPPTEKEGQRLFPTGNFRFYRPVYRDKTPPCNHASFRPKSPRNRSTPRMPIGSSCAPRLQAVSQGW